MATLTKKKNPFKPDEIVRATKTIAYEGGVIHAGETYRGGDPAVEANWTVFVAGDTLDQELPNMWEEMPAPPQHAPPITVQSIPIPAHRQVVSMVSVTVPVGYSPGSYGEANKLPPSFARTTLTIGQILDALSPTVREHPGWFRWRERDVTPEDVERLERLEGLEPEQAA